MSVVMLPKYEIQPGEDPEITALRLHNKKNRAVNAAEDLEFPPYRFRPYPTAMYRKWDDAARDIEIMKVAGKNALNLENRRERMQAEHLVGEYETLLVGKVDYIEHYNPAGMVASEEVVSELRERNDREHAARLEEGWADSPDQVNKAWLAHRQRVLAGPAAERNFDDRHLGEAAKAELDAIDSAADDHVIDVAAARQELQDKGVIARSTRARRSTGTAGENEQN